VSKICNIEIRLLGDMQVLVDGEPVELPRSRKTRALLAYLALRERGVRRDDLCGLLWDNPSDPRAALRWSLTKIRSIPHFADESVLRTDKESVWVDHDKVAVDAALIRSNLTENAGQISDQELLNVEQSFGPNMLPGLEDVGGVEYQLWLESARNSLIELHGSVINELLGRTSVSATDRLRLTGRRVALAPLDDKANIVYLREVLKKDGIRSARDALDRVRENYKAERQSDLPLVAAWRQLTETKEQEADVIITASADQSEIIAIPDKPSVAVLDFTVVGSHPDGGVLANGLAVDLNSRLARLHNLFVIARASSAKLSASQLSLHEIGAKLGVRYLVSGSTQREKKRVRVTVTLLDANDESEVWSEHYDRPVDDLFDVQDDITGAVVAAIEPAIERAEMQRTLMKPPNNLTAWEYFHRGLWHCFRFMPEDNEIAHQLFAKAIALDPYFSRAHAGLSFTHYSRAFLNSTPDVDAEIRRSLEAGRASVSFDSQDSMAHWSLGRALFLSRQHDEALASIDQALLVNPNYAQGHYAKGFVGIHAGADEASLNYLDAAQRLSPFDPLLFAMKSSRGMSLANQGNHDEAVAWAIRATHEPNAHFHIYAIAAACLKLAGREADASNNATWALQRRPDYTVEVFQRSFPHKDEEHRRPLLDALEAAGIPRA